MRDGIAIALLTTGGAVALLTALVLRTRLPAPLVLALLAACGAGLAIGALLLLPDASATEWALSIALMSILSPAHVRVVVGPFGRRAGPSAPRGEGDRGFEILEHTAEVGIRSWGPTAAEAFEQAGLALAEILGAASDSATVTRPLRATASDREALLVDFLNELNNLHEAEELAISRVRVLEMRDQELQAEVDAAPMEGEPTGVAVKAATYHSLAVRESSGRAEARVYLDV